MKQETYTLIESYMKENCGEAIHDEEHIYRVLYNALDIADYEENVNHDILITACLLHDIGRAEEMKDKSIDHAEYGSKKAYEWLINNSFDEAFSRHVANCIATHRYRGNHIPSSIEAKILFDADKIDAAGFMGIARTLMYKGLTGEPVYIKKDGVILDGNDNNKSFFREYIFKLSNVYDTFFTQRAKEITSKMKSDAEYFYKTLYNDINTLYSNGQARIYNYLNK